MYLLVFEFLGTNELLLILVAALILFGPRKLPQLSRSLGKSLAEFKRASEDFKRTWEREVEMDAADQDARIESLMPPAGNSILEPTVGRSSPLPSRSGEIDISATTVETGGTAPVIPAPSVTPTDAYVMPQQPALDASDDAQAVAETPAPPQSKRDWF